MNAAYGRPTAGELVAAVAEFLETFQGNKAPDTIDAQVRFHARVAANALRIVERELLSGTDDPSGAALSALGFDDETALAAAIRAGELDQRPDDVIGCLRILVRQRLAVAHPGYDSQ